MAAEAGIPRLGLAQCSTEPASRPSAAASLLFPLPVRPAAGLLFPLPGPTRRGGCVSMDFLRWAARRPLRPRLPTFKTATAETAARTFATSVFRDRRDVGLPGVVVSDRDTRFFSAFWTGPGA